MIMYKEPIKNKMKNICKNEVFAKILYDIANIQNFVKLKSQ